MRVHLLMKRRIVGSEGSPDQQSIRILVIQKIDRKSVV